MSAPELLPCPFCGGEAEYILAMGVACRDCGGCLPCPGDDLGAWNRRAASLTALQAENARLQAKAGKLAGALASALDEHEQREGVMSDKSNPHWSNKARAELEGWSATYTPDPEAAHDWPDHPTDLVRESSAISEGRAALDKDADPC